MRFAINVFFSLYLSAVNCRFRAKGMAMSSWQLIFIQSKVNNGVYDGDRLVAQNWEWPKDTWFQTRLHDLRTSIWKYSKQSEQPCSQ